MHWILEALIWAGLTVGAYFGFIIIESAKKLLQNKKTNRIKCLKYFLFGLFISAFCIVYAFFRFVIDLDHAIPKGSF